MPFAFLQTTFSWMNRGNIGLPKSCSNDSKNGCPLRRIRPVIKKFDIGHKGRYRPPQKGAHKLSWTQWRSSAALLWFGGTVTSVKVRCSARLQITVHNDTDRGSQDATGHLPFNAVQRQCVY
jgi:hypothetical protein